MFICPKYPIITAHIPLGWSRMMSPSSGLSLPTAWFPERCRVILTTYPCLFRRPVDWSQCWWVVILYFTESVKTTRIFYQFFFAQQQEIRWSNANSQFYGRSRQCGRPVVAWCSFGLVRNPLINGLIQHTFILVLTRKPKNASKRVWMGPKHN